MILARSAGCRYFCREALLLARREVALDPGLADQRRRPARPGRSGTAPRHSGSCRAWSAAPGPANRRRISSWSAGSVIVLLGDRSAAARATASRGLSSRKSGDRREVGRLAVLDHAQPAQRLGRQRIVDRRRPGATRAAIRRVRPPGRPRRRSPAPRDREPCAAGLAASQSPTQTERRSGSPAQQERQSGKAASTTSASVRTFIGRPCSHADRAPRPPHRARRRGRLPLGSRPYLPHPRPALMVRQRVNWTLNAPRRTGHVSRLHCGAHHAVPQRRDRRGGAAERWSNGTSTRGPTVSCRSAPPAKSPTLSHAEHERVVELCIEAAAGRVPVIAGAGSNSTDEAISLTRHAKQAGADARWWSRPTTTSRPRTGSTPTSRRSTTRSTCR